MPCTTANFKKVSIRYWFTACSTTTKFCLGVNERKWRENKKKKTNANIILRHRKITKINMDQIWILHIIYFVTVYRLFFVPSAVTMLRISHACHQIRHVWVYTILNKCANYPFHHRIQLRWVDIFVRSFIHPFKQINKGRCDEHRQLFRGISNAQRHFYVSNAKAIVSKVQIQAEPVGTKRSEKKRIKEKQ